MRFIDIKIINQSVWNSSKIARSTLYKQIIDHHLILHNWREQRNGEDIFFKLVIDEHLESLNIWYFQTALAKNVLLYQNLAMINQITWANQILTVLKHTIYEFDSLLFRELQNSFGISSICDHSLVICVTDTACFGTTIIYSCRVAKERWEKVCLWRSEGTSMFSA